MIDGILALDGGNSKTDVLLVASDGTVLSQVRGPGASAQREGLAVGVATLDALVRQAVRQADPHARPPYARHTAAYMAGVDFGREQEALTRALTELGWSETITVDNDTFALLRAGTRREHGVAVVCGAGINCVGVAPDGRTLRFPAIGRLSGDWGGGLFLGDETLWRAVRAEDGRGPDTALLPAVTAHFGVSRAEELVERLHFGEVSRSRLVELTPLLFATARAGDAVARKVVDRLAREVVLLASAALRRLDLLDVPVDIVLGGGVLASGDERLLDGIRAGCRDVAPKAEILVVDVPPAVGAALLGLQEIGAHAEAEDRLRDSYRTAPLIRSAVSAP
ncbi:ATPase [Planotetraspora sp. A-T 1434]|uniref:N-acetylglucosamine kinase n=1 Tax=Planotetraspora sp. A-T 1434 TaxID=2979219 RepID=UPI0021C21A77|nr:BadF/BadG/BcrA/BcrD ATPase family protein [Planotetraspora sp. A-T 1434]MCT9932277.1 ATPase [Planotetraspora sp. A-T 1434]